jgi:hypothetical protein
MHNKMQRLEGLLSLSLINDACTLAIELQNGNALILVRNYADQVKNKDVYKKCNDMLNHLMGLK